jgi:hypothetical protein
MTALPLTSERRGWSFWWKPLAFLLVAAIGLYYVKWSPYYLKSFIAADTHTIGGSIINDNPATPWAAALAYAQVYFLAIWKAAVLAVILGSLVQVLIPRDWLLKMFGRAGLGSTVRGGLFALPGMMCSCCAAPVAAGLRKQNVSVGAALAFWIANPVLNPATLVFMGFVLGWGFTALRLVAGLVRAAYFPPGSRAGASAGSRGQCRNAGRRQPAGALGQDDLAVVLDHHSDLRHRRVDPRRRAGLAVSSR